MMDVAAQLRRGISRRSFSFRRQASTDHRKQLSMRFSFGRQSSLDPNRRSPVADELLMVPGDLDATMQLLFMASRGDTEGVEDLLNEGVDVDNIDMDGRTALHIASCEGHVDVVKLLLRRKANINARDRWGSTAAVDAKHYGNMQVYNILKAHGAKVPKEKGTPMKVANPKQVPEYELNPHEVQVRKSDGIAKGIYQEAKWNGTKVAVKILDTESQFDPACITAFKHELTLLEKVRHPNLVQFVGAVTQNIPMMILVEYPPRGDLGSHLQRKKRLSPSKALRFALDIARGMNYLHECKPDPVVHCNLMPNNIFLDNGGRLKIAGFGLRQLSTISSEKFMLAKLADAIDISRLYMAPELHNGEIFDKSVDVYSFGVILYEMIEGMHPFHPQPREDAWKIMCLEGKRPSFKKLRHYPPELKALIEVCWSGDPAIRPSFEEIIIELDRVYASCTKQGWWKDTFRLPWL